MNMSLLQWKYDFIISSVKSVLYVIVSYLNKKESHSPTLLFILQLRKNMQGQSFPRGITNMLLPRIFPRASNFFRDAKETAIETTT